MRTRGRDDGERRSVTRRCRWSSRAFAPVSDVRRALTPELRADGDDDASCCSSTSARARTGSAARRWRRSTAQLGAAPPDLDDPALLQGFFAAVQALNGGEGLLRAYHDRSDGGLFVTLLEMAFAGGVGLDIELDGLLGDDPLAALFAEELGAVLAGARRRRRRACGRSSERTASATLSARLGRAAARRSRSLLRDGGTSCSRASGAACCAASGRRRRTRCRRCATTRPAPTRSRRPASDASDPGLSVATYVRPRRRRRRAASSRAAARARASRSCASRASTARSRWPPRSIAPASRRSTCT